MPIEPLAPDAARAALDRVENVVVVMMENRSFDHMLGYLALRGGSEVDGLDPGFRNVVGRREYPVHHLERPSFHHYEDPKHGGGDVAKQVANGNAGFAANYLESRPDEYQAEVEKPGGMIVMGYYDERELPTYDHLASHFCVCDRWFSSVPGATWPNRLYAMCGQSEGRRDNKKLLGKLDFPVHFLPSFARHLDDRDVGWRWYHARAGDVEPPTLQLADARYFFRPGGHFALFDRREPGSDQASFLEDAADGNLQPVSWIDPDFGITKRAESNDDHPPADVRRGQALVRQVCNAVMEGPQWDRSLVLVVYDEHGGFFDHVPPPVADDDHPDMRRYGVRVPALVVSPFVPAGSVGRVTFDHTSIIRTILERFCRADDGRVPWMGARTENADHLGTLLTEASPRPPVSVPDAALPDPAPPELELDLDGQASLARPRPANMAAEPLIEEAGGPPPSNDLQLGLLRAGLERRQSRGDG